MRIHLLDMGTTMYGDCVLVTRGNRRILSDGGHPGDAASIREQLSGLFAQAPPFPINLLVVTHCHSDHIGCLPKLLADGDLTVDTALVADETLGFAQSGSDATRPTDARAAAPGPRALLVALQEESRADMSDAELREFLADAATLEDNYVAMLRALG